MFKQYIKFDKSWQKIVLVTVIDWFSTRLVVEQSLNTHKWLHKWTMDTGQRMLLDGTMCIVFVKTNTGQSKSVVRGLPVMSFNSCSSWIKHSASSVSTTATQDNNIPYDTYSIKSIMMQTNIWYIPENLIFSQNLLYWSEFLSS